MYSKPPEQQVKELEDQLRDMYLGICDTYMQMSKVKDACRLDRMQAGVDNALQRAMAVRQKMTALQQVTKGSILV